MLHTAEVQYYPLDEQRQYVEGPQAVEESQSPEERRQWEQYPPADHPVPYRERDRLFFNRNHLIKRRNGTRRPAGARMVLRRWRRTLKPNPSHVALQKPVRVDADLAAVIGCETASRAQILKLLWDYVKANGLQNPQNGRLIVPDAKLSLVVGSKGKEINGFTMMKTVKYHILKDDVIQD